MSTERRQFTRIHFEAPARLRIADAVVTVDVVDISLKGALVRPSNDLPAGVGIPCFLEIDLDDSDAMICMAAAVAHRKEGLVGLACREIDLDSITHLRRLVELNVGDETVLNRELSALAHAEAA